jgi:hypothetical protein
MLSYSVNSTRSCHVCSTYCLGKCILIPRNIASGYISLALTYTCAAPCLSLSLAHVHHMRTSRSSTGRQLRCRSSVRGSRTTPSTSRRLASVPSLSLLQTSGLRRQTTSSRYACVRARARARVCVCVCPSVRPSVCARECVRV